jgi:hypothetical protein
MTELVKTDVDDHTQAVPDRPGAGTTTNQGVQP